MQRRIRRIETQVALAPLAASLALVAALLPAAAEAHPAAIKPVSPAAAVAALGDADRLQSGLYRVTPAVGPPVLSHGPDPVSDYLPRMAGSSAERAPSCAADHYQHVLVGHLAGAPDRLAAVGDGVRRSVRRIDAVVNEASLASGGPTADLRVLCDARGQIRLDSFAARSSSYEDVVAGARAAGFAEPGANYTIFFDAPAIGSWCGMASFESDERLAADNANNSGGGYAVAYQPCWDSLAPLHEIAHNQGAVQRGAPNSTGTGGHCNQLLDVVCFAPDGGDKNQVSTSVCLGEQRFDCGDDDYFDSAPEPGEYLASHWNLGSALNRFIDFGVGGDYVPAAGCRQAECAIRLPLGSLAEVTIEAPAANTLYRIRVPRRSPDLRVRAALTDDLELRIRRRRPPATSTPPCPARGCHVSAPRQGTWYVSVGPLP